MKKRDLLTQRQVFIRIAGIIGALGGVLAMILGAGFLVVISESLLWLLMSLVFLLIAVGTIGYYAAGRHVQEVSVALGIMLIGALLDALGVLVGLAGEIGWTMLPVGLLIHQAGLLLLGVMARRNPGFMRPGWLPLVLGAVILTITIGAIWSEFEVMDTVMFIIFGAGWLLLGLLLFSGNVRTDVQPPSVA